MDYDSLSHLDTILDSTVTSVDPKENKLDYYNLSHKGMSYSRSLTLHSCPRKFELDSKYQIKIRRNSVTFAYGHAIGEGIQAVLAGDSVDLALTKTILAYDYNEDDIGNDGEKAAKKSIWWAVLSVELFAKQYQAGLYTFLDGWVVAEFDYTGLDGVVYKRKASELSFVVDCTEGYTYEGHIDLVLYNPSTNRYMVLELKTTGMSSVSQASYKNSSQALGYGIVIDKIADSIKASASFDVLYIVYKSRTQEIVPMLFTKTPVMRAQWLTGVIIDIQAVENYEANNYYPHRGESCYSYFRDCEYLAGECHMSTGMLERAYGKVEALEVNDDGSAQFMKMETPDFTFTLSELADRQQQLLKVSQSNATDPDMLLDITNIG